MSELTPATTVSPAIPRIEPEPLAGLLRDSPEDVVILDVRRREAWSVDPARLPRATWLPLEALPRHVREISRESHLVVYCS